MSALGFSMTADGEVTPMNVPASPDLDEALRFLSLIDPTAQPQDWRYRAIHPDGRAQNANGGLHELQAKNLNGWGAFVVINAGGHDGASINRVRALYVDFDQVDDHLDRLEKLVDFEPTVIVESSAGKHHAYWCMDGVPVAEFSRAQEKLIALLGSDKNIKDLPRVMRLPGYLHTKAEPFKTNIYHEGPHHNWADFSVWLDTLPEPIATPSSPSKTGAQQTPDDILQELLTGENVHGNALRIVARMVAKGFDDGAIRLVISNAAPHVSEARGADRANVLMGGELEAMIAGARAKGYAAGAQDAPQGFEEISQSESGPDDVDLLNPPGLAGEICRYIAAGARRQRPEIYPFAALHLMALAGRERRSVYTSKLNLITLAIAQTAAGKERPQDAVKRLAHTVKRSNLIHGNAGSFKDLIYNLLEGDGASLYIVDEVHSLFDSMKSKNAQSYESKMEAEILTMSSTELYTFRGMEKRQLANIYRTELQAVTKKLDSGELEDEQANKLDAVCKRIQQRINWLEDGMPDPFFSLMGHSVPERLDSFVSASNIDSGFIGRALVMRCPETREKLRRTDTDASMQAMLEVSITEALRRIQSSGLVIPADDAAAEYLSQAIDWYDEDEQLNHPLVGGIYARAPEHLYRVSTILALNKGTITLEHARYAHALVKQSIADVKHIMLKAHTESGNAADGHVKEHARQTIHRNCKGQGQTLSRLRQIIEKPKGWQDMQRKEPTRDLFNELLTWMLDKGEIERITNGRRERIKSRAVT